MRTKTLPIGSPRRAAHEQSRDPAHVHAGSAKIEIFLRIPELCLFDHVTVPLNVTEKGGKSGRMKITRSGERGSFDHGWLKTHHSFSFGDYYDPEKMGYRS